MNHFQKYYTVGKLRAETLLLADYEPKHFFRQPVSRSACDLTQQQVEPTISADYRPKRSFRLTAGRNHARPPSPHPLIKLSPSPLNRLTCTHGHHAPIDSVQVLMRSGPRG